MTKERFYYYSYLLYKHASFGLALILIIFFFKMYLFHTVHAELLESKSIKDMTNSELEEHKNKVEIAVIFVVIAITIIHAICMGIDPDQ